MPIIAIILFVLCWMYLVGPLLAANAVAHSDTNLLIGYAKADGEPLFKLRVYQVLHCLVYVAWGIGLLVIPFIIKHQFA